MRLIELSANKDTFRTVRFNETGLTLIVGKRTNPADISREHSTNGVGKSLLLYLVSFCLGSKVNPEMEDKLAGWSFTLMFEIDGSKHTVTRSTDSQKTVTFDNEVVSLPKFTDDILGRQVFGLREPRTKFLTFRSLIGLFLRLGKTAYISEEQTASGEKPYTRQLRNTYLLGLDTSLADRKRELREEHDRLMSIRTQFKKDSLLRDYFHGDRDVALELADLDDKIEKLQVQAADFQVAENYEQITAEADVTRRAWQQLKNELNFLQSSIRQIEASLTEQPDISTEIVRQMYESAQIVFPASVQKQLDEVTAFHSELVESRFRRLTSEKHRIERQIEQVTRDIQRLDEKKDEYYRFLGTHGALKEYEALHNNLSGSKRRADQLRDFQRLEQECKERTQQNKLEMSQENIRATEYLKSASTLTDEINERFRGMARRIWPNHTCGLIVRNNEGENQIRFNIDARIQGDASDGISETKIFCFDMAVLLGQMNHGMHFIMHDNRLYHGIDPRQRAELFRIADELTTVHQCQYIASINEDNLTAMREIMEAKEFDSVFHANTILELTDDSDKGKLLGVTVDLLYENPKSRD